MTGLRRVFARLRPPSADADLVRAFAATRDEAAFAELVRRHGPLVLGACRRVFAPAADDAFQATFLLLALRAGRLRDPAGVAGWLHGVAVRTAREAKAMAARRRLKERRAARPEAAPDPPDAERLARLDAAVQALPARFRAAVVLCDLQELTRAEAAAELGVPAGTVASRLARGRKLLAGKLGGLPAVAAVAVPPTLAADAVRAVAVLAAGGVVPPALSFLVAEATRTMTGTFWKPALAAGLMAVGVGGAWALQAGGGPQADPPPATPPKPASLPKVADPPPRVGSEQGRGGVRPASEAVQAVRPLAAWAGEYTYRKTEFDADGTAGPTATGQLSIRPRSGGGVVSLEKRDDSGYDDLTVVHYTDGKVVGTLYWTATPRALAVTFGDATAKFVYAPAVLAGGGMFTTWETLTRAADGSIRWLVEWQMADGSFVKRRELVATKK